MNGAASNGAQQQHDQQQQQQQQPGASDAAPAAAAAAAELPPPWLDVTEALQYLVAGGRLELHGGVSKLGLMGFGDVAAPGAARELYVAYAVGGRQLFEKVVADDQLLRLPGAGEPVCGDGAAARLWARFEAEFGGQQQQQQGVGAVGSS